MWQHLEPRGEEGISFWMRWREVLFSFFSLTPSVPPSGFVVDLGLEMGQEARQPGRPAGADRIAGGLITTSIARAPRRTADDASNRAPVLSFALA